MEDFIGVRLSAAERTKLEALAEGEGVTMSQIVREIIRRVPVRERSVRVTRLHLYETADISREAAL